jgi:quercetin dioxygenase-like cupin family protein
METSRREVMLERDIIEILDGLSIEIVVSSRASNYTCCVFIETTPPGGGPPPHKHDREEEIFTVLEGEYEFFADGAWTPMEISRSILSLRGTYHAFRNVGQTPARMMLMTNNGGIDDYFRAISSLKLPDDIDRLTEISKHYGYSYLPPSES